MNLVDSGWSAGFGAAAGGLAAYILMTLGVGPILGDPGDAMILAVGLTVGLVAGAFGRARWLLVLNALLLLTFVFITDTPTMARIANRWVRADSISGPHDAIIVLSGYVLSDSAINTAGTERLLTGMELYQDGVAPRLVTTKVDLPNEGIVRSSSLDQAQLLGLAHIVGAWTEVDSVTSTRGEAVRSAQRLLPVGARRVVVVTSPFHTRRACATFEAVGFTVTCRPARERQVPTWHPINSEERLAAFGEYVYERLGMIKYRWKGWLPAGI